MREPSRAEVVAKLLRMFSRAVDAGDFHLADSLADGLLELNDPRTSEGKESEDEGR